MNNLDKWGPDGVNYYCTLLYRKLKDGVKDFLGLNELSDEAKEKLRNRRRQCYRGDVSPAALSMDEPDSAGGSCRPIPRRSQHSVAAITWQKAKVVVVSTVEQVLFALVLISPN